MKYQTINDVLKALEKQLKKHQPGLSIIDDDLITIEFNIPLLFTLGTQQKYEDKGVPKMCYGSEKMVALVESILSPWRVDKMALYVGDWEPVSTDSVIRIRLRKPPQVHSCGETDLYFSL